MPTGKAAGAWHGWPGREGGTWPSSARQQVWTAKPCPPGWNMVGSAAMKQYVIDELNPQDRDAVGDYLKHYAQPAGLDGMYWLPIEEDLLSPEQHSHNDCKPFVFALELLPDRLVCELLVRTCDRVRCNCIAYATSEQREWLIETIDAILSKLGVKV
jgi:hypothetical protein